MQEQAAVVGRTGAVPSALPAEIVRFLPRLVGFDPDIENGADSAAPSEGVGASLGESDH